MRGVNYIDPLLTMAALRKHNIPYRNIPIDGIFETYYLTRLAVGWPPTPTEFKNEYPTPEAAAEVWASWLKDKHRAEAPQRERERNTKSEAETNWEQGLRNMSIDMRTDKFSWMAGYEAGRRG